MSIPSVFSTAIASISLAVLIAINGCVAISGPSWNMDEFPSTDITPTTGVYDFVLDSNASSNYSQAAFMVAEKDGKAILRFASDGYRFDDIVIANGSFYNTWGELGGRHCPTDSYGLSGHFVSTTEAKGQMKFAYDGKVRKALTFKATLGCPE